MNKGIREERHNMLVSRKRRLPTAAAAAPAGSTAKRVLRSTVVLLVFSENHWLPLCSTEEPRADLSQAKPTIVVAAKGAFVIEADTAQATVTRRAPFIDDGMFDPRRDYWGNDGSRPAGADSMATTPASSNWNAGEMGGAIMFRHNVYGYVCCVMGLHFCALVCRVLSFEGLLVRHNNKAIHTSERNELYDDK